MTPETLRAYGEALYGDRWPAELASALDVHPRTMRRWMAGTHGIPDSVAVEIATMAHAKLSALAQLPPP